MDIQYITLPIKTDADAALLLDMSYELIEEVVRKLRDEYGEDAEGADGSGDEGEAMQPAVGTTR